MAKKELPKKSKSSYSRLFTEFAGEHITIAVKSLRSSIKSDKVISNVMFEGYLLDECEDYYYLGQTHKEIFAAIKKTDVSTIMMGGEQSIEIPEGAEIQ